MVVSVGRDRQEAWMDMYTLLYLKWITNKDLLHHRWTPVFCGREGSLGENGHMYLNGPVPSLST